MKLNGENQLEWMAVEEIRDNDSLVSFFNTTKKLPTITTIGLYFHRMFLSTWMIVASQQALHSHRK
jgi:hypothetical protein